MESVQDQCRREDRDGGKAVYMEKTGRRLRRAFVTREDCVACGCCVKVCPLGAIAVVKGIAAQVDGERCVGCGKCARECPGTVIEIREVPA
ncbi:ATP-binding protein [Intestinimonas butyriciproducens]